MHEPESMPHRLAAFLAEARTMTLYVRVNPLDSGMIDDDLAAS